MRCSPLDREFHLQRRDDVVFVFQTLQQPIPYFWFDQDGNCLAMMSQDDGALIQFFQNFVLPLSQLRDRHQLRDK